MAFYSLCGIVKYLNIIVSLSFDSYFIFTFALWNVLLHFVRLKIQFQTIGKRLSIHIDIKSIFVRTTWTCLNHLCQRFNVISLGMMARVSKCDSLFISVSKFICLSNTIFVYMDGRDTAHSNSHHSHSFNHSLGYSIR